MNSATVKHVSECFIKPKYEVQEAKQPYYLAPMDLAMLNFHYIQKGLLFIKPSHINDQEFSADKLLQSLKESLSLTLVHFYPLAGKLATRISKNRHECLVFVDCKKGPGAKFIYATLDMTISDILSPVDVPPVVQSLFDHDRAINHDGHKRPLLSIQVTELKDGVFIGCSMNHVVVDGTSYWHFWKIWSEIHRANGKQLLVSRLPNHKRWFPDGYGPVIPLPFTHPKEFSLSALVWRSTVRANCLPEDQITNCRFAANNRQRLDPPLPPEYVGNCVTALITTTTAGELLGHNLGWAASLLHQSVVNHSDKTVHKFIIGWLQSPFVYQPGKMFEPYSVMMGSSPRFDMYGNEFGLGKAVAVRSGYANKYVGKVTAYPGYEGGGSVDLEICLPPKSMSALESDEEFMSAATIQYYGY
uniref:HXXXD-type acyl-transferase family protein n=1 Tax=Chenopodium quinoa TaxID=63459 RepID=A0A803LTZ4_CHEQI